MRTLGCGHARVAVRGPIEHAVLDIAGELDFSNARELVDLVGELEHRIASIDLGSLEFIDIAGARALDEVREHRAALHGERPAVIGASPHVARTLRYVRARAPQLAVR